MYFPISYASRQLNVAEKNYTTTKREGLSMIYVVKKLRHYLLATQFVFFVDHQALLYLVNKPCCTGHALCDGLSFSLSLILALLLKRGLHIRGLIICLELHVRRGAYRCSRQFTGCFSI